MILSQRKLVEIPLILNSNLKGGFGGVEGVTRLSRWVALLSLIGGVIYLVYLLRNLETIWLVGKVSSSSFFEAQLSHSDSCEYSLKLESF